jgi:L,D-transpeptidase-like protein
MLRLVPFLLAGLLAALAMSCSSGSSAQSGLVTIEPLVSPTASIAFGGKPAAPPASVVDAATAGSNPAETPVAESTTDVNSLPAADATPAGDASLHPTEGRWIEVDVTNFVVRLMDGTSIVREISPVAVGAQVDTGAYASTQTGLFHVYNKSAPLAYDAPYDTYISDWVGFDPDKSNGFHSFLKDKDGKVVNGSTGRVSNGCIRTGAETEIYAFAAIGMPVWVHA